jgi:aminoglycoside/choline kinase family phosphotransferase
MKDYQIQLTQLFEKWSSKKATTMEQLAQSGSDRRYFRIEGESKSAIGTYNADFKENRAFIRFTQHFYKKGLKVPEVYAENLSSGIYLQEDLGDLQLFNLLPREGEGFEDSLKVLFKKVLVALANLQIEGGKEFDYNICYPRAAFDKQSMLWDLNYFKHYFVRLAKVNFDESALEEEFQKFADYLLQTDCEFFLFRDFQSRNVMIHQGEPYFIDYQGGRKGALQYDVASLLYQAKGNIPDKVKEELLDYYIDYVSNLITIDKAAFRKMYYAYALIRCLQTLGAYGFRGLYERKEHFITSIPFAIENLKKLMLKVNLGESFPEMYQIFNQILSNKSLKGYDKSKSKNSKLTVHVNSFSYKKEIPKDDENGGGFVFDCRFIDNPGRIDIYKKQTGRDLPVIEYLKQNTNIDWYLTSIYPIIDKAIETYVDRGFSSLYISFGCTGGQHRSVYSADQCAKHIAEKYKIKVALQHIEQEAKNWVN